MGNRRYFLGPRGIVRELTWLAMGPTAACGLAGSCILVGDRCDILTRMDVTLAKPQL